MSLAALTEKAKACFKSLEDVSAWAIWSNAIKPKDLDARVAKGLDFSSKLEAKCDASATDLALALTKEVDRCNEQANLLKAFSSLSIDNAQQLLTGNAKVIAEIVLALGQQDVASFLSDIGRKLCDLLTSSEGAFTLFFQFIVIKDAAEGGLFGFSYLLEENKKMPSPVDELVGFLCQSQTNLVNYFLDRFRAMGSCTEAVIRAIPSTWFLPDICRPKGDCG